MAFADPVSITINAVAKSLQRISQDGRTGLFESVADGLSFKISHSIKGKRVSRMVRLDRTVLRADPITGLNTPVTDSCWLVYAGPTGTTVPLADQKNLIVALADELKETVTQDKFLNGES